MDDTQLVDTGVAKWSSYKSGAGELVDTDVATEAATDAGKLVATVNGADVDKLVGIEDGTQAVSDVGQPVSIEVGKPRPPGCPPGRGYGGRC
jgi:hypothetical protein